MLPNPQKTADLVTFTEEILIGKLHFLRSFLCSLGIITKFHFVFCAVRKFCFL